MASPFLRSSRPQAGAVDQQPMRYSVTHAWGVHDRRENFARLAERPRGREERTFLDGPGRREAAGVAPRDRSGGNVRFGSKADIAERATHVRFTLKSRHRRMSAWCPFCAISGLMHCSDYSRDL